MELRFLGTGAADWPYWPDEKDAQDLTNRIRRVSSVLVDDTILIDPAPSAYRTAKLLGVDCTKIRYVLLTHSHDDHFNADTLASFRAEAPGLEFLCSAGALPRCPGIDPSLPVRTLHPMDVFRLDRYEVTALPGNHLARMDEITLHYVIRDGERSFFYSMDSGWFTAVEWEWLMHKELDCAVLDCTCGDYLGDFRLGTHNSIPMIRIMEPSMRQNGMLRADGRIILQHLARTLHKPNAEVEADMAKEGYLVAKDGLLVTI